MPKTRLHLLLLVLFIFAPKPSLSRAPYALRISCGAREDVHSPPSNTQWYKDFAYTGGIPYNNATRPSFITPVLTTLRYFPLSDGPENCYNIKRVPHGHYLVRIYFGLVSEPSFDNEPLFDVSIEGTLVYSLPSGWSNHDDERAFLEALIFLKDGTSTLCFHSTGHGDPSILAIEILQIDNKAYYFGRSYGQGTILRTHRRVSFGSENPKFGSDYSADRWGGDRFWDGLSTFGQGSDRVITTSKSIKQASTPPNFYPEALYQTGLTSTDAQPDLSYVMEVEPNRNYSLWLHFAEIDPTITGPGQRVFDVLLNGDVAYSDVDIVSMSGGVNTALVLNTTVVVSGRSLTITLHPTKGTHAIISAVELLELVLAESKTLPSESMRCFRPSHQRHNPKDDVSTCLFPIISKDSTFAPFLAVDALQKLKSKLGLPLRLGWNGDPCVPEQHPWSGINCLYDRNLSKHVIEGLDLDNQGLSGSLPSDISRLRHLQTINLSGNSISGTIPSSLGSISGLQILDLSFNLFSGSIPESIGQLTSLQKLELNGNSLSGKVPSELAGKLLHGASFNFTDNGRLCGIPGLPSCGTHLSPGAITGIVIASILTLLLLGTFLTCWWKRRQNILRTQRIAARDAPYAKARTHFSRDVQMMRQHNHHEQSRLAAENGPSLLA